MVEPNDDMNYSLLPNCKKMQKNSTHKSRYITVSSCYNRKFHSSDMIKMNITY